MTDDLHGHDKHTPIHHSLGAAGVMAKAFINSPLSPLFLLACLALGFMGLVLTPRQEDPQISVPMVDVLVEYPGASSEQVSSLVTEPLERILSEISGVKHVYSGSMRGQAMVTVEYDVGENLEESLVKLYDKLESNMDKIPPGVTKPLVKPKAVDDVPVVTLTLWSNELDDSLMRVLALDLLQRLKEVPNTSQGFVVGGRAEQIRVEVFPERLSGYGISLDQIAHTIQTANSERGVGNMESGDVGYKVYTGAFLKNAKEIGRLVVGTHNNRPIYISDVARVFAGPEETSRMVTYTTGPSYGLEGEKADHAQAVTIAIAKKPGSNGVTVAQDVLDKVESMKGNLIPSNVHVSVTRNYGETAREKVNELLTKLVVATGAVMILVWLTLGFKPAIVVIIVIPIVILMTVFSAWILGYTIDRVSLFALIFSIGILVDDAIVVVENIYRRWLLENHYDIGTTVDAVREVGNPTILATFTVIAALLPMGFVSGMMGPYMEPIPALGSVAMLLSLFAAFIFTPWLTQRIKPSMERLEKTARKEHRQAAQMERFYRWAIIPLATDRKKGFLFLGALLLLFFGSMIFFYTTGVRVKILPLDNKPEFNVVINMPEGTALPRTANLAKSVTNILKERIPEVTALQTYIGSASPFNFNGMVRHYYMRSESWQADIQVQLTHKKKRKRTSHDLAVLARELITPLVHQAGGRVQVVEMPPGPPVLQSIVAEITGPDADTRRRVAWDMSHIFMRSPSIVDVDNYMEEPYEVWRFQVDTEKAVRRGVSVDALNRNLAMAMGGFRMGDIKRGAVLEPTFIVLQIPLDIRANLTSLGDLPIPTATGGTIPLAELGRFVRAPQDPVIYHKDLRPVEFVTGEVTGRLDAPIYGMLDVQKMLMEYKTPDGVTMQGTFTGPSDNWSHSAFEWTGEWTVTYETFRDMGIAFGAALILIYMLVVWEFGNFILPAIIMAPIPLTLIGIIPGHWLLDAHFTATSMIGFIALAGIIVRNSILLVDFTQQEILQGTPVMDAVILSCKARTRPILITAFALVLGSSVIITDFIFMGMAISLLFGVLVSTLLTLIVIPLGCISAKHAFIHPDFLDEPEADSEAAAAVGPGGEILPPSPEKAARMQATRAFLLRAAGGPNDDPQEAGKEDEAPLVDEKAVEAILLEPVVVEQSPVVEAVQAVETPDMAPPVQEPALQAPAEEPVVEVAMDNDVAPSPAEENPGSEETEPRSGERAPAGRRRGIRLKSSLGSQEGGGA